MIRNASLCSDKSLAAADSDEPTGLIVQIRAPFGTCCLLAPAPLETAKMFQPLFKAKRFMFAVFPLQVRCSRIWLFLAWRKICLSQKSNRCHE